MGTGAPSSEENLSPLPPGPATDGFWGLRKGYLDRICFACDHVPSMRTTVCPDDGVGGGGGAIDGGADGGVVCSCDNGGGGGDDDEDECSRAAAAMSWGDGVVVWCLVGRGGKHGQLAWTCVMLSSVNGSHAAGCGTKQACDFLPLRSREYFNREACGNPLFSSPNGFSHTSIYMLMYPNANPRPKENHILRWEKPTAGTHKTPRVETR